MKRKLKLPHIIVRFRQQVPPPTAAAAVHDSPSTEDAPNILTASPTTVNPAKADVATLKSPLNHTQGASAAEKKMKRTKSHHHKTPQKKYGARGKGTIKPHLSYFPDTPPSPPLDAQLIGKRKREDSVSIGGGKGDLQMPRKKVRTATVSAKFAAQATSTAPRAPESTETKDEDKRVLRSQDTIRKTDLSEWFMDEKEEEDYEIPMEVLDEGATFRYTRRSTSRARHDGLTNGGGTHAAGLPNGSNVDEPATVSPAQTSTPPGTADPHDTIPETRSVPIQTIDLEAEARASQSRVSTRIAADPLSDEHFIAHHRREEREEKRLRNIERERLAHDKQKLEEMLEKLQGPDWMKLFGVNGTGSKADKKEIERKRAQSIKYIEGVTKKYKEWKELERKQKLAKGGKLSRKNSQDRSTEEFEARSHQEYDEDSNDDFDSDQESDEASGFGRASGSEEDDEDDENGNQKPPVKTPRLILRIRKPAKFTSSSSASKEQKTPEPKAFTSFYKQPHMRKAAFSDWRRSGRLKTAFGHPVPEMPEKDFSLPGCFFQSAARHLRARRRETR
ncbi:hypothetical protein RUND412_003128 [Rhizina undulata]